VELGKSKQQLLRFVSLIPYLEDSSLGAKLDVWNTSDSFLELCAGDSEEHAVLLCNYLLHEGKEAYVVLGTGIPEGETAYVLTKEMSARDHRLWNASSGRVYSVSDSALPLSSVGCVFNDTNVWANVQSSSRPHMVDWHLMDATKWRPFFGAKGYPPPRTLQSVQKATLRYRRTSEEYRKEVEREVEGRLQQEIEDLRGHRPTDWNRSVAAKLRPLLKRFEEDANGTKQLSKEEHDASLERVRATYKLVGFPMNVSFTEIQPLLDKIRNTNIWMSDGPKMQFVLATYVHAYPNNICSVWVYVASLDDMRAGATASVD
jgi:coiled-coil and C2 domain-containing protein 2A